MAIVQAATEGAQTLLPVYVFDREKFNTPTLAGKVKQKRDLSTTHVVTLQDSIRQVLERAVPAELVFCWKVCSVCDVPLKRWALVWLWL